MTQSAKTENVLSIKVQYASAAALQVADILSKRGERTSLQMHFSHQPHSSEKEKKNNGKTAIKAKPDLIGDLLLVIFVLVLPIEECDHH